jgi:hypothetical protein
MNVDRTDTSGIRTHRITQHQSSNPHTTCAVHISALHGRFSASHTHFRIHTPRIAPRYWNTSFAHKNEKASLLKNEKRHVLLHTVQAHERADGFPSYFEGGYFLIDDTFCVRAMMFDMDLE